jgi:hypothetical protein
MPLSQHRRHRHRRGFYIARVQTGHAHAARAHQVHRMLFAQLVYLFCRQAGVAEHAALGEEVVDVLAGQLGLQHRVQPLAHELDAPAHVVQLVGPLCVKRRGLQNAGHDLAAMGGRAAVVLAHGGAHLAEHQFGLCGVGADHAERAAAFAVEREAFGKRAGAKKADACLGEQLQSEGGRRCRGKESGRAIG